ncbi:MAG TPA: PAS domain S-box protein [Actinomycetota bacterium]|nr:PAS domain S-box protein [Actinomycetota bacterium]
MKTDRAPAQESGYRSLFQRIPVALYRSTLNGAALAVNPAMVEMLRYPDAETLLRQPVEDHYVDSQDRRSFIEALERDGRVVGFEARLRRRDGTFMWTRDSARAVKDEDGTTMYVEGAMVDVTEQKQAEVQLRRQAGELSALHDTTLGLVEQLDASHLLDDILARAAALLDTEHAYLYVVDPEADELVVRAQVGLFAKWAGYRLRRGEGLAGRVWLSGEALAVDDYGRWPLGRPEFDFIRAAVALPLMVGSEVAGVIGLVRTEDRRPFTAQEVGLASRFARMASLALSNARLYDAAQRELAERRQVEKALRRSERRYRTLVETSSEWIWSIDLEGRTISTNSAVTDILGYRPEEILNRNSLDLVHPEDRPDVERWLAEVVAERRGWSNVVIRWQHKDGSHRWLESNGVPILDEEEALVGYWGADRDISERVRAGENRRRLLGELVRLQEEERRRIATEIHDDPVQAMTAVEMRLESLRRRIGNAEEQAAVDGLSTAVSEAIGRLRRILVEVRPPRLDQEGLASALRGLLDRLQEENGASVHLEDRSLHEIPVDARTVLYRIAQEALTNIRKHADAMEVRILVAERAGGVVLRVRDDGRGFDPGRSADERPGHLGLVSMRERAELAGGKFRITSRPGVGTSVVAWVPAEGGS